MPGGQPRTIDGRLSAIEADISWIRGNLAAANLGDRVTSLELRYGQFRALIAGGAALVTILLAAAKATGVIH
jgi:hypothetical protein